MDIHYEGDLFVSRSSADAQTTWIELRFKMDGENKISVPLTAQIGGDGKVLELLAPKADSSEMTQEISILKDLLAVFIFRNNEDTVGRYEAVYTDFSGGIRKEKTKYISYGSTHVPKVDIIFSKHEWTASADPYFPRTIAGEEKTGSDTNQGLLTYSQYQLVRKVDPPILHTNQY